MVVVEGGHDDAPYAVWQVYKIPLLLGALSLLFIVVSITIYIKTYQDVTPIRFSSDEGDVTISSQSATKGMFIFVDIEGAVIHPGVYRLPPDAHVEDLISAAGGFSTVADAERIGQTVNRAAKLSDGAKVYIPRLSDTLRQNEGVLGDTDEMDSVSIRINSASSSELESLAGVGSVTAEKIIQGRPYMRLEELVEKKAMSQSVFDRVKNQLAL